MPINQQWLDPSTGALYAQSHVRVTDVQADQPNRRATVTISRWATPQAFLSALVPISTQDLLLSGSAFDNALGAIESAAAASYRSAIRGAAGSYVYGLAQFSGGIFAP